MIEILVVDHPPAVRRTLCDRLGIEPDLRVVGEAEDSTSAVSLAQMLRPCIALLDAEMPNLDLRGTVKAIHGAGAARVVILTLHTASARKEFTDGVVTVVGKHEGAAALLAAIRLVAGRDA